MPWYAPPLPIRCSLRPVPWHCSCAGNNIGDGGCQYLCEMLKTNRTITTLNVFGMPVPHPPPTPPPFVIATPKYGINTVPTPTVVITKA